MTKRTYATLRALIWMLCVCLVTGLEAEAAQPAVTGGDHGEPDTLAKTKPPRRVKAPRRAPRRKKRKIKTDDVGARAYDFGYTMGILSGVSHQGAKQKENLNLFVTAAQKARNALDEKISFKGFKPVRIAVGHRHGIGSLEADKVLAARLRYQKHISAQRGRHVEHAYILGVQMGITELTASMSRGMTTQDMKVFTGAVLSMLVESDLSKLDLDTGLMEHAERHCGSKWSAKISEAQARNIHAAVLKARIAYRDPIAKAPATFWTKSKKK